MANIEWVIKATGERKITKECMPTNVASKLVGWLNAPNAGAIFVLVPVN